jgi:CheY-like chemotaxis protein
VSGERLGPRIVVLADDLIWAIRLIDGVRRAGGVPVPARTAGAFATSLAAADGVLVDLTARAYDGLAALTAARDAGIPAIAVAQHDDVPLRQAAKAGGASRVYAYRALFEHGDRELGAWLATLATVPAGGREEGDP